MKVIYNIVIKTTNRPIAWANNQIFNTHCADASVGSACARVSIVHCTCAIQEEIIVLLKYRSSNENRQTNILRDSNKL